MDIIKECTLHLRGLSFSVPKLNLGTLFVLKLWGDVEKSKMSQSLTTPYRLDEYLAIPFFIL